MVCYKAMMKNGFIIMADDIYRLGRVFDLGISMKVSSISLPLSCPFYCGLFFLKRLIQVQRKINPLFCNFLLSPSRIILTIVAYFPLNDG